MLTARDNPFATERVLTVRYRFPQGDVETLLAGFAKLDYRAALVGPEGAGKTTLLEDLRAPLAARGFQTHWLQLRRDEPRFDRAFLSDFLRKLTPRDLILFDGAEQLSRWAWRRFRLATRAAGGLLITSHREGMLPTLLNCRTSPELLKQIVAELLPDGDRPPEELLDRLFIQHNGNLRLAIRELYDLAATGICYHRGHRGRREE